MSIVIKTGYFNVRGPNGQFIRTNTVAEETTEQMVEEIESAGSAQVTAIQQKGVETLASIPEDYTEVSNEAENSYPISIVGEKVAIIKDGVNSVAAKAFDVTIYPFQSGSGNPSSSNVRPFVSFTKASVFQSKRNLIGQPYGSTAGTSSGITATINSDGSVTFNGTASAVYYFNFKIEASKYYIAPGKYVISSNGGGTNPLVDGVTLVTNVRVNGTNKYSSSPLNYTKESTPFNPLEYGLLRCYLQINSGVTVNNLTIKPMIRMEKDPILTYEAYSGSGSSFSFPSEAGTVYGGKLNVIEGKLSVFKYYSSYSGESLVGPWLSSKDVYSSSASPTNGSEVVDLGNIIGVYDVTPVKIRTLDGYNAFWSSCGEVTIEYKSDPIKYIDAKATDPTQSIFYDSEIRCTKPIKSDAYRVAAITIDSNNSFYVIGGAKNQSGLSRIVRFSNFDNPDENAVSNIIQAGHANDITYDSENDRLLIACGLISSDTESSEVAFANQIKIVDPNTLTIKNTITLDSNYIVEGIEYVDGYVYVFILNGNNYIIQKRTLDFLTVVKSRSYLKSDVRSWAGYDDGRNLFFQGIAYNPKNKTIYHITAGRGLYSDTYNHYYNGVLIGLSEDLEFSHTISFDVDASEELEGYVFGGDLYDYALTDGSYATYRRIGKRVGSTHTRDYIPPNSDLNDYISIGEYFCNNKTNSGTIANNPDTNYGFSLVVKANSIECRLQILTSNGGDVYVRTYNITSWTEWKKLT